ncbi:MAG: RHS repeat-associated core domain-containing protein, partial [Reichenbachiella sp.]|uniref:RHS repeat-associated core domain-containing protein n=1 Tax=Reichenbachiella sp. TaxID=2184521 RepID=UPI00329785DF
RKATSGAGCGSEITPVVEISIAVTLDAGTISGTQSICDRDLPNDLTGSAPSGGMGAFTYQWESSTDQASWSPVVGETTADLSFSSFTQSAYYRRSVSNGCGTDVSNEVLVTFVPLPDPGTIAGAQDLCVGISPTEMTGTDQPGVTYQWQSSVDGSTWEDVAGATQQSYLPPTATLYYRRVSTENNCEAYSNTVLINIRTTPVDAGSNQILMNDQGLMVLTGSPAGGTWSGTGVSTDNFDPDVAGIGTHELTYTYTDGHCVKEDQRTITVNFNNITVGFMEDFAFQYRYDERQRMVMKQVPGADSVEMIYDKRDRLVLTRDGNQRAGGEWSFTKYDQLNRPVLTGIIEDSRNRAAIESEINAQTGSDFYESYTGTGALMGYDGSGYPSTATAEDLLTVTYYDNYQFSDDSHWTLGDYTGQNQVKTLVTGARVSVPGRGWNESATFYDSRNRMTSTVSKDYQGNYDSLVNEYYSLLHPLVIKTTHYHESALTQTSDTITMNYTYDHGDRLMSVTHQVNDETAVVIIENEYSELGELITKKLNKESAGQYSQEIDYEYNIRGWLTKINDPVAPDASDYFNMQLKYDDAGQYNGNIGATNWKNPFEAAVNSYNYSYDPVNRIKSADYSSTVGAADFDVNNISYDANGNILTLQRTGDHDDQVAELFDDLDYDYVGNQLTKVTDASGKDTGFKDGVNTSEEYVYDANGNMISDANKGIEKIEYNHLNLPIKVEMNADGSDRIEYIYDAAGIKMAQIVYEGGVETKRTDYQGAFIYESKDGEASALQFIQHDEGRVVHHPEPVPGSQTFDYQYHLKDHLGNVRTTFKTTDDVDVSLATFESGQTATEAEYFSGYDGMTKITADLFNHTSGGNTSIRLNGSANETEGIGKSLKVKPGDVIDMEVYAKYFNASNSAGWGNLLTTLVANIADPTTGLASESGGIGADAFPFADWTGKSNPSGAPKAYMNYMVFDQNYGLLHQGYQQISTAAEENGSDVAHEKLSHSITITEAGYVYIYLSNETGPTFGGTATPIDVFFDDFTVTQNHTPIVSKDDYYPFGLTFNSYQRAASTQQNFKYNGKEKIDALGIDWYHYGARYYDPALGRWHVIDQDAENYMAYTPYNYVGSNPIRRIDPDGNNGWDIVMGAAAAVLDNASAGIINLRGAAANYVTDASDFNNGQDIGDAASVTAALIEGGIGGGMIGGGEGAVAVGLAAEIPSGGTSTAVVAAGGVSIAAGAGLVAHGTIMGTNGAANLADQKGRLNVEGESNQGSGQGRGKNKRQPDSEATGDHTVSNERGSTTYKKNDKNPSGFQEVKRVDKKGASHGGVETPHTHENGKVRSATPDEIPKTDLSKNQ